MHIDALFTELANVNGVFEVARVLETFELVRNAKDGRVQCVTVQILDNGTRANPHYRYGCFATADDGRTATGNPDESIEMAIKLMHWEHLDLPLD
ncbi:hypothetical protein [Herpetosiphon geysericola]|uniref:Uncharacterized protein n=1 Tax=Herpetosiphon geysericola TaxID=70996 RepID=A0A0P6Y6M5_9CHLR|nr:hypothetical protein [Herpetosiphon geysericola]KPL87568.1 hypothetical protein SE18_10945 [Herpetosiphon geysericola]